MMYATPNEYGDEEALQMKCNHQVVEKKERLVRKAYVFAVLAFVVVCSVRMRGSLKNEPLSSNDLIGERSLKGLFGLCGKKDPTPPPPPPAGDGFTPFTWEATVTGITVASGAAEQFKSTAPAGDDPYGRATVDTGGNGDIYLSYTTTKPADGTDDGNNCHSTVSMNLVAACALTSKGVDATVYVWFVGKGASDTTFSLLLGPD